MTSHHDLPYQPDNSDIFARFQEQPWALWLDSQSMGRFELITALPRAHCHWSGNTAVWGGEAALIMAADSPFAAARALHAALAQADTTTDRPTDGFFQGGIIGYWAYDANGASELPAAPEKPGPHCPQAAFGWYDWFIRIDHEGRRTELVFLDSCPPATRRLVEHVLAQPAPATPGFQLLEPFLAATSAGRYAADIQHILDYIDAGDCYQVNYSQAFSARYKGSPWAAYRRLREDSRSPWAACLRYPFADILCLSPEQFLDVADGQILSRPIKGTRPRHPDPARDAEEARALLASAKDRAENVMITDLLRNDIGRHALTGSVSVPRLCQLESYSLVHHLVSTVSARLPAGTHPFELFRDAFPGGSITGAPKRRAMEIINELEPTARSVYCGSIAWLDVHGNMGSNIAIRTLVCKDERIWAWAGGGITADSRWEDEYQECFNKIGGLLRRLEAM
jgi:para-aminobenzoate synthetase component 1